MSQATAGRAPIFSVAKTGSAGRAEWAGSANSARFYDRSNAAASATFASARRTWLVAGSRFGCCLATTGPVAGCCAGLDC